MEWQSHPDGATPLGTPQRPVSMGEGRGGCGRDLPEWEVFVVESRVETTAVVAVIVEGRLLLRSQETFVDEVILRSFGQQDFAPESGRFLSVGSGLCWALGRYPGMGQDGNCPRALLLGYWARCGIAHLLEVLVGSVPSTMNNC